MRFWVFDKNQALLFVPWLVCGRCRSVSASLFELDCGSENVDWLEHSYLHDIILMYAEL